MSRHDDEVRLRHMLDHAREAVQLGADRTEQDLHDNRLLNLGLVRLIEIIGEAASKVSSETQSRHADIPWPQIIAMRNRIIHGYDTISFKILLEVIQDDLPPLIQTLEKILAA